MHDYYLPRIVWRSEHRRHWRCSCAKNRWKVRRTSKEYERCSGQVFYNGLLKRFFGTQSVYLSERGGHYWLREASI